MKKLIILIAWAAVLPGCTSSGTPQSSNFTKAPLLGIVYTMEGTPLVGVEICVDDTVTALSDTGGRFVIPPAEKGVHYFTFKKEGYETLNKELNFTDPSQMIYSRLTSMNNLITELTRALKNKQMKAAESLLTRASVIDPDSKKIKYLKAVYFVKKGKYPDASSLIEELIRIYPQEEALLLTLKKIQTLQGGINED